MPIQPVKIAPRIVRPIPEPPPEPTAPPRPTLQQVVSAPPVVRMSTPPVVPEPVALPKPTPQQVRTAAPVVRALPPQEREPVVLPTLSPARLPPTQAVIVARPAVHTVPVEPLIASDPTLDPTLLPPTATYAGSHPFYLTDAGAQADVSRWATFPAVQDVDLSGNALVGASDISTNILTADEAGISTFLDVGTRTTTQDLTVNSGTILLVDPSGSQVLQAVGTDLFYDGQRLARAGEIPNLADWATFPAVQDVDVSGNSLRLIKELTDVSGAFGTAGQLLSSNGSQIAWVPAPTPEQWATFPAVQDVDVSGNSLLLVKELTDVSGQFGTAGQLLSSTGAQVAWVTPTVVSAAGPVGAVQYSNGSGNFLGNAGLIYDGISQLSNSTNGNAIVFDQGAGEMSVISNNSLLLKGITRLDMEGAEINVSAENNLGLFGNSLSATVDTLTQINTASLSVDASSQIFLASPLINIQSTGNMGVTAANILTLGSTNQTQMTTDTLSVVANIDISMNSPLINIQSTGTMGLTAANILTLDSSFQTQMTTETLTLNGDSQISLTSPLIGIQATALMGLSTPILQVSIAGSPGTAGQALLSDGANTVWGDISGGAGVTSLNTQVGDIAITSANANLTVDATVPGTILLTVPDQAEPVTSLNTQVGDIAITSANANLTVGSTGPGNILLTVPSPAASVTSVNGATGAVTVAGASGVTASTVGQTVTLSAPGIATAQSAADAAQATANTALADAATAEATAVAAGAAAATADATAVAAGVAAAAAQATASTALAQSGVTAVNSGTGAITVAAGTGISVGTVGSTITVSNTGPTITPFSYNIYVSNVTGSDVTGAGLITNPYKTIGTAMTAANAIADSNPVILCLAPGTYAENVSMTRDNVYIVGGSTSLSTATNIAGTVTVDMTGSAQTVIVGGLSSVQLTNIVYTNTVARNQTFVLTDCLIVPGLGVSAISATDTSVGGNGDMTIQNSLIYMSDTVAVVNSNVSLNFINTQITNNPLVTSAATMITTTGTGRVSLFGCSVIQTSTSTTVQPLINIGNTASSQVFSFNNAILQYTSAAVDAGTGKCCIRLANSAAISSVSVINSLLICEGARVTNGIPTQYLAIQRTGAGTVTLNYGQNLCGATANHLPAVAVGLTKTPYIVLGN